MRKLEELFEKGFYTMAFLRTLVCVIFLALAVSCGTLEKSVTAMNKEADLHKMKHHWYETHSYTYSCRYCNFYNDWRDSMYQDRENVLRWSSSQGFSY